MDPISTIRLLPAVQHLRRALDSAPGWSSRLRGPPPPKSPGRMAALRDWEPDRELHEWMQRQYPGEWAEGGPLGVALVLCAMIGLSRGDCVWLTETKAFEDVVDPYYVKRWHAGRYRKPDPRGRADPGKTTYCYIRQTWLPTKLPPIPCPKSTSALLTVVWAACAVISDHNSDHIEGIVGRALREGSGVDEEALWKIKWLLGVVAWPENVVMEFRFDPKMFDSGPVVIIKLIERGPLIGSDELVDGLTIEIATDREWYPIIPSRGYAEHHRKCRKVKAADVLTVGAKVLVKDSVSLSMGNEPMAGMEGTVIETDGRDLAIVAFNGGVETSLFVHQLTVVLNYEVGDRVVLTDKVLARPFDAIRGKPDCESLHREFWSSGKLAGQEGRIESRCDDPEFGEMVRVRLKSRDTAEVQVKYLTKASGCAAAGSTVEAEITAEDLRYLPPGSLVRVITPDHSIRTDEFCLPLEHHCCVVHRHSQHHPGICTLKKTVMGTEHCFSIYFTSVKLLRGTEEQYATESAAMAKDDRARIAECAREGLRAGGSAAAGVCNP